MTEFPEADANVTTGSIQSAASVLRSLARASDLPSEEYGRYLGMAERLDSIAEQRQSDEPEPQVIPIPEDALDEESAGLLAEAVVGWSDEPIVTPDEQLPDGDDFRYGDQNA